MVKLNRSNRTGGPAMALPVPVRNATVALTVAESHRRTGSSEHAPTRRVIRWLKPKLPNLDSTEAGCAIPPVYWASIEIRSAAILKKSSQVLPVNPKYVGKDLILSLKVDESCRAAGAVIRGQQTRPTLAMVGGRGKNGRGDRFCVWPPDSPNVSCFNGLARRVSH